MTKPVHPVALIIIDMQNAFLHPHGESFYPTAPATIPPVSRLMETARETNALRVFTLDRHRRDLPDFEQKRLPVHGIEGSDDADYFDHLRPDPERALDVEIIKRRFSAFFSTDLGLMLRECGVETVVLCGVKTNVCVRATAQDAFANGFEVVVPEGATNSNRDHLHDASLEDISRYLGRVVSMDEALALFTEMP